MPISILHPGLFALGLVFVSIPIILHLLKKKRRPIPWAAMMFLEQAYRKRRKRMTIEQLILLTLRCLILLAIAFGVGALMFGHSSPNNQAVSLTIILDQSISSAREIDHKNLNATDDSSTSQQFHINANAALKALDTLDSEQGDVAGLILAGSPAQRYIYPPTSDIEIVRSKIKQLTPTDSRADIFGALQLVDSDLDTIEYPHTNAVFIAADLSTALDHDIRLENERTHHLDRMILIDHEDFPRSAVCNVGIASAYSTRHLILKESQSLPLGIQVNLIRSKYDGSPLESTSTLVEVSDSSGQALGSALVNWDLNQREESITIAIDQSKISSTPSQNTILSIRIPDDSNDRDNEKFIALPTRKKMRVGVIHQHHESQVIHSARWIRAALQPDDESVFEVIEIQASQASSRLHEQLDALCILSPSAINDAGWDRIQQLHQNGLFILITPNSNSPSLDWITRVNQLSPDLLQEGSRFRTHEPSIGLHNSIEHLAESEGSISQRTQRSLFEGIESEISELTHPVRVFQSVGFSPSANSTTALEFEDQSPMVLVSRQTTKTELDHAAGFVVVLATALDLDWTDLMTRPIFVPMINELIRQGVGQSKQIRDSLAGQPLQTQPWVSEIRELQRTQEQHMSQGDAISPNGQLRHAGVFSLLDSQGITRSVAVVHPDTAAANLQMKDNEETTELFESLPLVHTEDIAWISAESAINTSTQNNDQPSSLFAQTSPTTRASKTSLTLLFVALGLAIIELILARIFSSRLFIQDTPKMAEERSRA